MPSCRGQAAIAGVACREEDGEQADESGVGQGLLLHVWFVAPMVWGRYVVSVFRARCMCQGGLKSGRG